MDGGTSADRTEKQIAGDRARILHRAKAERRILAWFDTGRGYYWVRHYDPEENRIWSRFEYADVDSALELPTDGRMK